MPTVTELEIQDLYERLRDHEDACDARDRTIASLREEIGSLQSALYKQGWQPIELAPMHERVLVRNEMWEDTFGEVQIAVKTENGWEFDSGMLINGTYTLDISEFLDDDEPPITAEDFQPREWKPLPSSMPT